MAPQATGGRPRCERSCERPLGRDLLRDNAIAGAPDANDVLWISFGEISDLGREIRIGVFPSIKTRETPIRALGDFSSYRECLGDDT